MVGNNIKIKLISDTHFYHDKMFEYCYRPSNYNDLIWTELSKLNEFDILIHLGDISFKKNGLVHEKISRINAKKILVRGNHDKKTNNWYLTHGWDFVCESFVLRYFGLNILFSHKPTFYNRKEVDINIHGHLHEKKHRELEKSFLNKKRNYYLISCELQDYKTILLDDIVTNYFKDVHRLSTVKKLKKYIRKSFKKIIRFLH